MLTSWKTSVAALGVPRRIRTKVAELDEEGVEAGCVFLGVPKLIPSTSSRLHGAWLPGGSRTKYVPLAPQTGVASARLTQWVSRELEINSPGVVIHFELPGGSWEPEINSPWGVIHF